MSQTTTANQNLSTTGTTTTLRRKTTLAKRITRLVLRRGPITSTEVAQRLRTTQNVASSVLSRLVKQGTVLVSTSVGPKGGAGFY